MISASVAKLALGMLCFLTGVTTIRAAQETTIKRVPARPSVSIEGKALFAQYCAVCHGVDAKGAGPAASSLKQPPTDLTQISKRNRGKFPERRMLRVLEGKDTTSTPDMPVWCTVLYQTNPNLYTGQIQLHSLLRYLEALQAK